ncbi:MAG: phosphatase PAP2 family protein [Verrucomicrobia bacterium]|nr:MAG: phosphatase PAP2 family protein [Verrucomicrobiota bacterium]
MQGRRGHAATRRISGTHARGHLRPEVFDRRAAAQWPQPFIPFRAQFDFVLFRRVHAQAYAAASFVAYSRVEAREHYPRDVIAGASIGIVSSYIFTRHYKGWSIELEADRKYCGLSLRHAW